METHSDSGVLGEHLLLSQDPVAELSPGSFLEFVRCAEQLRTCTQRLTKSWTMAAYFAPLSDHDLGIAARYLAGFVFPQSDPRPLTVASSVIIGAMSQATGIPYAHLRERYLALESMNAVAHEAFPSSDLPSSSHEFSLSFIAEQFEVLVKLTSPKRKTELVAELFRRMTPLESRYLVKMITGDIRTDLQEASVEDAVAYANEVDLRLVQWVNILTGDIGQTALLAKHRKLDQAELRLFHPVAFMLASASAGVPDMSQLMPRPFVIEDQFQGARVQIHVGLDMPGDDQRDGIFMDGVRVAIYSKTLEDVTSNFPDLFDAVALLLPAQAGQVDASGLILDGMIIPFDDGVILPLEHLKNRLRCATLTDAEIQKNPVAFVAFDILYSDGRNLIQEVYTSRMSALDGIFFDRKKAFRASSRSFNDLPTLTAELDAAYARGNRGLILKNPSSYYKPGRRGPDWIKVRRMVNVLNVVVTAAEVAQGRRGTLLSQYTVAVRGSEPSPMLVNIGKVSLGLSSKQVARLSSWFQLHTQQEYAGGRVRVVEPEIVLELTFERVCPSTRNESGYELRSPRILRLCEDKTLADIDTMETVLNFAEEAKSELEPEPGDDNTTKPST